MTTRTWNFGADASLLASVTKSVNGYMKPWQGGQYSAVNRISK